MSKLEPDSDGYLRIRVSELATVQLRHVASDIDPSIAVDDLAAPPAVTGFTEWAGNWKAGVVSIGWDWGVVNGLIVVINPQEIRTNLRVLSEAGEIEPVPRARIHLLEWIETVPWRQIAIEKLLADGVSDK